MLFNEEEGMHKWKRRLGNLGLHGLDLGCLEHEHSAPYWVARENVKTKGLSAELSQIQHGDAVADLQTCSGNAND